MIARASISSSHLSAWCWQAPARPGPSLARPGIFFPLRRHGVGGTARPGDRSLGETGRAFLFAGPRGGAGRTSVRNTACPARAFRAGGRADSESQCCVVPVRGVHSSCTAPYSNQTVNQFRHRQDHVVSGTILPNHCGSLLCAAKSTGRTLRKTSNISSANQSGRAGPGRLGTSTPRPRFSSRCSAATTAGACSISFFAMRRPNGGETLTRTADRPRSSARLCAKHQSNSVSCVARFLYRPARRSVAPRKVACGGDAARLMFDRSRPSLRAPIQSSGGGCTGLLIR